MARPRRLGSLLARVLMLAALSSCSENAEGELTVSACNNTLDDDGDGRSDCDDSDCWVYCSPRNALQYGDAASQHDAEGHSDAAPPPQRKPDAGKAGSSAEDDAGMPPPRANDEDAGAPKPCDCAAGEKCVDGQCRKVDGITGTYELSVRSAFVPLYNAMQRCYDYSTPGPACTMRLPGFCECAQPDPYVVVLLEGKVLSKATTPESRGTSSPVWPDAPKVQIMLKAEQMLTFVVYDYDGFGQDAEIFRCSPDLSPLADAAPVLSCSPDAGTTMAPPRNGNFAVTVAVRKIAAQ